MKHFKVIFCFVVGAITFLQSQNVHAINFHDVSEANRNYMAIKYLSEKNILNGYPDATFKPNRLVSRVEFLKIVLESAKAPLDVENISGFKDVEENAWYAKYLRKAKKEGWVQGYPDGTFKPEQSVNKVEGLKIIAAVSKWEVQDIDDAPYEDTPAFSWYGKYVAYAKNKNFLEETENFFTPSAALSRGKTSEILFRILITAETKNNVYSEDLINRITATVAVPSAIPQETAIINPAPISVVTEVQTKPPTKESVAPSEAPTSSSVGQSFTTVGYRTYSKDFFDNIKLGENFPNIFYLNEVYYFEGEMTTGTYKSAFIFLKEDENTASKNSAGEVIDNRFRIPFVFRKTGNYKLGLIPGNSGTSKVAQISVIAELPKENSVLTAVVAQNPAIQFKNGKTTATWDVNGNNLNKITVFQENQAKTFFSRQKTNSFNLDYVDFKEFKPGKTYFQIHSAIATQTMPLSIDSGWVKTPTQEFTATQHHIAKNEPGYISYTTIPEVIDSMGNIALTATAKVDLLQEAAVIKPDGKVETFKLQSPQPITTFLNSNIIAAGNTLNFQYTTTQAGTHIIEINEKNGSAAINTAIYVKNNIPLIPDFFDLNDHETQSIMNLSLEEYRKQMLDLINQERNGIGLAAVILDDQLNTLAQNHGNDMLTRNFFGHVNPDNQTPDMRRLALKIPTDVGENLSKTPTLLYSHYGLMRSAVHRKNILNSRWQRVGIGMIKDSGGSVITVQEFSYMPLTLNDLENIKIETQTTINQKRSASGLKTLNRENALDTIANEWSGRMTTENFFSFTTVDGTTLSSIIKKTITSKSVQAFILKSNNKEKLISEIANTSEAMNSSWETIGLGLSVDSAGILKLTVLYSTN